MSTGPSHPFFKPLLAAKMFAAELTVHAAAKSDDDAMKENRCSLRKSRAATRSAVQFWRVEACWRGKSRRGRRRICSSPRTRRRWMGWRRRACC